MKLSLRISLVTAMMAWTMVANAQTRDFSFTNTAPREGLTVEQDTRSGLQMRHALKQVSIIGITDNGYTGDVIQGGTGISLPANAGEPNLPAFSRFVAVPNGATAHIEMGYRSMTTVRNVDLMAAAPIKFDTDDTPNTYEKNPGIYNTNAFFPEQPVTVSEPFSLRGVQTVAVTVVPYQYNPVTKELRVYDDLQFDVRFDGGNGEFGDTRLRSPYWDPILMQNLANYDQLPAVDYEVRMQQWANTRPTGCEYLIVIPNNESFRTYANQLRDYRIQQGILTEVKSLADMGCTTTDMMKAYFHNAYNSWDIPPAAVLLLADHNTNMGTGIPAEYTWHSSDYGNCITDNGYADVNGDLLPEMAFSRLVAANANEAQMMVSKQLEYEYTNPNMDAASYDHPITALGWQTQRWFQICSEVVGGYWRNQGKHPVRINAIYSGTPGNSWSSNQNTYMVVNYFGPNGTGYIPATPSELGGWTGGTGAQVVQAVNNGCMLLQHRDHGYYQGWGEPDFSTSNVAQMNNVGKMTFVNTINCQTGTFDYNNGCLIEAFMRRTYNNQNAGAVGCIGPTQTSYSFVNDTYAWGMYDQYDPQFLPDFGPYANYEGNWRPAFGNVAGKYFLQQSSWPYNTQNKAITHKMFTAHCDAFLTLYTQVPQTMTVTHPTQITSSTTSINVSAPQGTVIALTRNNQILAVATATGASQTITFAAQPSNSTITVVGTKQDYRRYVGSITVISEPELVLTEVTVNDGNNAQLEYGEQASFDMVIKNVGDLASSLATATLSTRTPLFVTINQNTATIPALSPNQTTDLTEVFGITVASNVPNNTRIDFTLTMVSGNHTWTSNFNVTAYAPAFSISETMTVDDGSNGNGRLDPGETAQVHLLYTNNGGAEAHDVVATLISLSEYISISDPTINTATVAPSQSIELTYTVGIDANMPRGETAELQLEVTAGPYSNTYVFAQRVGLDIESFENGMEVLEWENDSDHPWTIVGTDPYSGSYCLQSGTIGNNETSTLSILFDVENESDEIRFFRKADSELSGDFLRFYIDNELQQEWSGALNWREMSFPVTQGEHTFTWAYEKNASMTSGADHVWIDEILFPVQHISFACEAGNDQETCFFGEFELTGTAIGYETVEWTSDGDGIFSHPNELATTYQPGTLDCQRKTVNFTLTAVNAAGDTLSDHATGTLHEEANIEMVASADICEGETYQLNAIVTESDHFDWDFVGDGQIGDPNNPVTTYIPGPMDIENGFVPFYLYAHGLCGDALAEFTLNIHRPQSIEFNVSSCNPYTWNGIEYGEEGDYEQTLQSVYGCDSIVTMHLSLVDTIYESEFEATGCDSYEWFGETYTESGDFQHIMQTAYGCDSIVTLHLSMGYTPIVEAIEGKSEIDVFYEPSSTYAVTGDAFVDTLVWAIVPSEAGTISMESDTAIVTWSSTYKGEADIMVTATNDCGATEQHLNVNVKNSTGVDEQAIDAKVFPNPTQGHVTVQAKGLCRLLVVNALGQVVVDVELRADEHTLDLSRFGGGMYLMRIYTEQGVGTQRVTVAK